jgi:beta-glucosidase
MSAHRKPVRYFRVVAILMALAMCLSPIASTAGPAVADPSFYPNVPYDLPVTLPSAQISPPVDGNAPYTPAVLSLIAQLELSNPPTQAELANADRLLHDTGASVANGWLARPTPFNPNNVSCHNVGPVLAPIGTTPSIRDICWTDAQGVLNTSGPQARGSTAPMTLMGLTASFDLGLANAWGQVEGSEAQAFMVTGLFGPQTDLDRLPNWGRNLTTNGEDPYLSGEMVAAQIHGFQGVGAMSEMKHYAVYNGQNQNANTDVQDQALHELWLTPYEYGFVDARAAAAMCSYQIFRDTSPYLPATVSSLTQPSPFSTGAEASTWPLTESHFSCEQPMLLNYVLRNMWGSKAFIGTDYGAAKSTYAILQGQDQEMPSQTWFGTTNPPSTTLDLSGSTCADAAGNPLACSAPGAIHISGLPAVGGPAGGYGVVNAVLAGALPLSIFNQSLARILYQEERFGMLGCEESPRLASCTNPGGVNIGTPAEDRTGAAPLPDGPTTGTPVIGTKNGDAAIVEKYSEMGATLLKNAGNALPLTPADLAGGILVTGANANHTVADPTNEASTGMRDRNAVNPLQQLKALSGNPGAFTFVPANDPTGQPVPPSALSTTPDLSGLGGLMLSIDSGVPTTDTTSLDHTAVNGNQLAPNHTYTWTGYLYVPITDTYTFAIQQSATLPTSLNCPQTGQFGSTATTPTQTLCAPFTTANYTYTNILSDAVSFNFDGAALNLNAVTANIYGATVPSNPTNAGYTDPLMVSRTCATGTTATEPGTTNCAAAQSNLVGGTFHPITITVNTNACVSTPPAAPAGTNPAVPAVLASCSPTSFRFAYSRTNGDITDAAAAAVGKSKAIVFVNTGIGTTSTISNPYGTNPVNISAPNSLSSIQVNLITAVAAANPNTIVVLNNDNPVLTPWIGSVKAFLAMWFAGQEGGTSTARVLLGQANPSGHTALTWPANVTDTIWGYNETVPLYPGEPAGPLAAYPNVHLERLNYNYSPGPYPSCVNTALAGANGQQCTNETEGIFSGYRFFDKEGITPQFPFGHGLSYTTFGYSDLTLTPTVDGGVDVGFNLTNTGTAAGAEAPQVYVGPGPDVPGVQQAVRALRGFQRVDLDPAQTKHVTIHLNQRSFQYWDEVSQQWKGLGGLRTIEVGSSSRDIRLTNTTTPFSNFTYLPFIVR